MHKSEEVFTRIGEFVKENRPFSLLRYGDGEGLFGFPQQNLTFLNQYKKASNKHWGEYPVRIFRERISRNLQKSVQECDIVGLPYGFDGAYWSYAFKRYSLLAGEKVTCSANIHIEMDNCGFLGEIIKGRHVFVLGCRDISKKLEQLGAKSFHWYKINEQHRFATKKPLLPFYKQVEQAEKDLSHMDYPGMICLMAAGVAGKHLGNIIRSKGGMVIDMGSVFDKWAGVKSRSWIKV